MTGMFELFTDSDATYRFQLTAPDGTVMALSRPFPDKTAAVAGIAAVREYAGLGHVTEIAAPTDGAGRPSVPHRVSSRAAATTSSHKAPVLAASPRDGAAGAPARPARIRIPSAARVLGARAIARNQQVIVRWRQTLGPRTAPSALGPC
jgi:uncharacterized protein YegP (UPF0339 family)